MAVDVCIWYPQGRQVGHSSLDIIGDTYISFWPAEVVKNRGKKGKWGNFNAMYLESYGEDHDMEGRNANYIITLHNLDEYAIKRKWREIQSDGKPYNLRTFNCSTIVIYCLSAGSGVKPSIRGKNTFVGFIGDLISSWTPEDVLDYTNQLKRDIG